MNTNEFKELNKKFDGIDRALCDLAFRITFDELLEKTEFIGIQRLDFKFLATIPIALYSGYVSPRIYGVLSDDNFFSILGEQAYAGGIQQIGRMKDCVSWQKEITSCPERLGPLAVPIALHFIEARRYDISYVVLIMRHGGTKIESLKITVYQPQPSNKSNFDLESVALEIMAAFQNGGWNGIEDLETRFETGVGCGSVSNFASTIINSIHAI